MSSFDRLIRFTAHDGNIYYGEAPVSATKQEDFIRQKIRPYIGSPLYSDTTLALAKDEVEIVDVLSPIPETPMIYGVGLNYKKHATEANFPIPEYPVIFTKPPDSLAGPYEDIPIGKDLQFMDYEGELSVVLSRDIKNLAADTPHSTYILGYTSSNDVSSRYWQMPERSGSQHGYAKSFDKFAPLGPVLVSPSTIPESALGAMELRTWVNGALRQETRLDDLIFDVGEVVAHLSRGTTLRRGTVVMMGTPGGVGAFMEPKCWLEDGDVVEVEITGVGRVRNKIKFVE